MMRTIVIAAAILLTASIANAQSVVALSGSAGSILAVQTDGPLHLRGGVISRQLSGEHHNEVDFLASIGAQTETDAGVGFVTALDIESERGSGDAGVFEGEPDFRARVGLSYAFTPSLAGVLEYSRSLTNDTPHGRIMFGGRIGFGN